jgi:hypothetical protein
MSSDSEDDIWHNTYPKNTHLLLTPDGQDGVLIPMRTETRLPFSYRLQRIKKITVFFPIPPHNFLKFPCVFKEQISIAINDYFQFNPAFKDERF